MAVGCVLFGCGASGTVFFTVTGAAIIARMGGEVMGNALIVSVAAFIIGGIILGSTFIRGAQVGRGLREKSPVQTVRGARIISKFALGEDNTMHFPVVPDSEFDWRYVVQFVCADGTRLELTCAPITYMACGEGMTGTISYKGDWLGAFTPELPGRPDPGPKPPGGLPF